MISSLFVSSSFPWHFTRIGSITDPLPVIGSATASFCGEATKMAGPGRFKLWPQTGEEGLTVDAIGVFFCCLPKKVSIIYKTIIFISRLLIASYFRFLADLYPWCSFSRFLMPTGPQLYIGEAIWIAILIKDPNFGILFKFLSVHFRHSSYMI
jgi:hypothetical protein